MVEPLSNGHVEENINSCNLSVSQHLFLTTVAVVLFVVKPCRTDRLSNFFILLSLTLGIANLFFYYQVEIAARLYCPQEVRTLPLTVTGEPLNKGHIKCTFVNVAVLSFVERFSFLFSKYIYNFGISSSVLCTEVNYALSLPISEGPVSDILLYILHYEYYDTVVDNNIQCHVL